MCLHYMEMASKDKKKKISLAVKNRPRRKKKICDDLVVKKRVGLSEEKKNMGWRLRPENIRFGFSYGLASAYRGDIIVPKPLARM